MTAYASGTKAMAVPRVSAGQGAPRPATPAQAPVDDVSRLQLALVEARHELYSARQEIEQLTEELTAAQETCRTQQAALSAANAKLEALATTDGLTGLLNHRAFQGLLTQEVDRARRHGLELSLLLIDIDGFKAYNAAHGHCAGDDVLRRVGELLVANSRSVDVTARFGGEEFAVLLPCTGRVGVIEAAERLRAAAAAGVWPNREITLSIGGVTMTHAHDGPSALIDAAEGALYHAKRAGRNRVVHAAG